MSSSIADTRGNQTPNSTDNGQTKRDKKTTNNGGQQTTQKTKDRIPRTTLQTRIVNSCGKSP